MLSEFAPITSLPPLTIEIYSVVFKRFVCSHIPLIFKEKLIFEYYPD